MMQSPPVLFVAWLLSVVCSLIANVRELAVWVVGTFISCTAFAGSIKAFKQRQANAKKRGTEIILRIQAYRTPFLDKSVGQASRLVGCVRCSRSICADTLYLGASSGRKTFTWSSFPRWYALYLLCCGFAGA